MRREQDKEDKSGFLLLDKPLNMSSNQALQRVKKVLKVRKAGHTGTLDPLATGLLILCVGTATKFSQYLINADKTYLVTAKLGETTSTGDTEGTIVKQCDVFTKQRDIETILPEFTGKIQQIPPMFSALKKNGQPLYKLAREGKEVEREPREVIVHDLIFKSYDAPYVTLEVRCSKGTYVRTLIEDIGQALQVGAHVTMLRRTKVGVCDVSEGYRLHDLEAMTAFQKEAVTPLQAHQVFSYLPYVGLTAAMYQRLLRKQSLFLSEYVTIPPDYHGLVQVRNGNKTLGLGETMAEGKLVIKRMFAAS